VRDRPPRVGQGARRQGDRPRARHPAGRRLARDIRHAGKGRHRRVRFRDAHASRRLRTRGADGPVPRLPEPQAHHRRYAAGSLPPAPDRRRDRGQGARRRARRAREIRREVGGLAHHGQPGDEDHRADRAHRGRHGLRIHAPRRRLHRELVEPTLHPRRLSRRDGHRPRRGVRCLSLALGRGILDLRPADGRHRQDVARDILRALRPRDVRPP